MALDKDQQAQLLKVGRSIGLEPRVGESWPEYQRRIREKQPSFNVNTRSQVDTDHTNGAKCE